MSKPQRVNMGGVDWVVCGPSSSSNKGLSVTIFGGKSKKRAYISREVYNELGKPPRILTMYSPEHKSIAFAATEESNPAGMALVGHGKSAYYLSCGRLADWLMRDGYSLPLEIQMQPYEGRPMVWAEMSQAKRHRVKSRTGGGES